MSLMYGLLKNAPPLVKENIVNLISSPLIRRNFIYERLYQRRINAVVKKGSAYPFSIEIEVTNLCNSLCAMCPRRMMSRESGTMSFETFMRIADQAVVNPDSEFRFIGYGEPLLDCGLVKKIEYAKQVGVRVTRVITNGQLLDADTARSLINSGLDVIGIDLDSDDPGIFNSFRKGLDYTTVVNNILGLVDIKKSLKKNKPVIRLQVLKIPQNFTDFNNFLRKWQKLVDIIDVNPFNNWAGAITAKIEQSADQRILTPCVKLWSNIPISWKGEVTLCCLDFDFKFKLGDINVDSLLDIWHSKFSGARQAHLLGKRNTYPLCKDCNWEAIWWRRLNEIT